MRGNPLFSQLLEMQKYIKMMKSKTKQIIKYVFK